MRILFYVNFSFAFIKTVDEIRQQLDDKIQTVSQMFFPRKSLIVASVSAPAGTKDDDIVQQWIDELVVTRVLYHGDFGGVNISDEAYQWLLAKITNDKKMGIDIFQMKMSITDMPRHHPLLIECYKELGEKFGNNMKCAVILGTQYRVQEYDGLEQVRTPAMDRWVDSNTVLEKFDYYLDV